MFSGLHQYEEVVQKQIQSNYVIFFVAFLSHSSHFLLVSWYRLQTRIDGFI